MHADWKQRLIQAGAEFDGHTIIHFGNPERERRLMSTGLALADLSHFGLIKITGPDSKTFLQGQLTCDVNQLAETQSTLGAHCSVKGRVLSLFRLFMMGEDIFMALPVALVDEALAHLKKYSIFSKVELEKSQGQWVRIGFSGPGADEKLATILGAALPKENDQSIMHQGLHITNVLGPVTRYEICGQCEDILSLWEALDVHAAPVGPIAWKRLDIESGLAQVYPETTDEFLPQSLALDSLKGISFDKGCYTGQEIIARTHYKGKVKRRLIMAWLNTDAIPVPGSDIVTDKNGRKQVVGQTVDACLTEQGNGECLAVVHTDYFEDATLMLAGSEVVTLQIQAQF